MLTTASPERTARTGRPSPAAVGAAVLPTARVSRLGLVALTTALGAVPMITTLARGATVGTNPVVALALATGAALGWAVDDPASATLDALPVSATLRRILRIVGAALVAVLVAGVGLIALAVADEVPAHWDGRVPEGAAAAAVALAIGLVAARRGDRHAGPTAVAGGVLGVLVLAALAFRWPTVFPSLGGGGLHGRWWWLVGAALLGAIRAGRDRGAR